MSRYDFPKVELHCHLDGAITPATLFELAQERGLELPGGAATVEELTPYVVYGPDCDSVNNYLKRFELPTAILQDAPALERCAYELVVRLAAQGHIYADIRFAPQIHTAKGLTQREATLAVRAGIDRALQEVGGKIKVGLIVCCMVVSPNNINREANLETAHLAVELGKQGVVQAMDLAGAENICPLSDFTELFDIAKAGGIFYTCHAGDSHPASEVRVAIDVFESKRLGHGHHIAQDMALVDEAIAKGITLEVCPTSNIQCQTQPSYAEHPIKMLFDRGLRVTVSTDNPEIALTCLDKEYDLITEHLGFTREQLIQMNIYAAEAAFLPEEEKAELVAKIKAYL